MPGVVACGCVGEALLASLAEEPSSSEAAGFASDLLLAGQAGQGVVRHGAHAGRELPRRLSGPANGAGKLAQGAAAGRALALLVRVLLRQLGSREGLLALGRLAAAALDALPRSGLGVQAPLQRPLAVLVLALAGQAGGFQVGPDLLPLRVREEVQALELQAPLAPGLGPVRLAQGLPVDVLASQLPQQEFGALGGAALEQPGREAAHDQHVMPAADTADHHGAVGCVDPGVHVQIQHDGLPRRMRVFLHASPFVLQMLLLVFPAAHLHLSLQTEISPTYIYIYIYIYIYTYI